MSFKTWISSSLAALALAATLMPVAPARAQVATPVPFIGGGTLYNFIDCEAQGWTPGADGDGPLRPVGRRAPL